MSCELKNFAKIDIEHLRWLFGLSLVDDWLNALHIAVSPTGEALVAACGSRIAFFESKFKQDENLFEMIWHLELANENDLITSCLCIPVIGGQSHSAEWTCIVIGTSSGAVTFYTDTKFQLMTQNWHTDSVRSLQAQSGKHINEELHVAFQSCVAIVEGHNLFPVLKKLRGQFSRNEFDPNEPVEQIPCRKWGFSGKGGAIADSVVVGPQKTTTFDHLLTASLEGGFYAKYRSAPPQNSLVLTTGSRPYVAFHYAKEGFTQPVLTDIARVATNLFKSALPSFLRRSSAQQTTEQQQQTPQVPVEPMVCRFGLCDQNRNGFNVWLAPRNHLAVVSDNLGRVILVDCHRAIALRVWKGYREAQCAIIEVAEKTQKNMDKASRRKAQFLVIYVPRRACVEVWPLQRGPKVASFTAPKSGALFSFSHSLMGVTTSSKPRYGHSLCLFFDLDDQTFKEISVPFHCAAINDANSKTAKDLHLYKRLKLCLRNFDAGTNEEQTLAEIATICQALETDDITLQSVEMLAGNKRITPALLGAALDAVLARMSDVREDEIDEDDVEAMAKRQLHSECVNYARLVAVFNALREGKDEAPGSAEEYLKLSESELSTLQKLLDLSTIDKSNETSSRVTFEDKTDKVNHFLEFLSVFDVTTRESVALKEEKTAMYGTAGALIFEKFLDQGKSCEHLVDHFRDSRILCEDLLRLLLHFWIEKPFTYTASEQLIDDMTRFNAILHQICLYAGDQVVYGHNSICPWWQSVREYLLDSSCALRGLLAAFICRNQALSYEGGGEEAWEQVTQEACQWTLLITRLDDTAVLGAILGQAAKSEAPALPLVGYDPPEISLKMILKGGKGIVTELVSKWLLSAGLAPERLLEEEPRAAEASGDEIEREKAQAAKILDPALHSLQILRSHFPFSLQSKALLCQLTWDYLSHWSNNLPQLEFLSAGLACLAAFREADWSIKHGVCVMSWNAHIKVILRAAKNLVDKTGRLPKERLCMQDIGMSDALVPQFLELAATFMHHFRRSLAHGKTELRFEEILLDDADCPPLTLLALGQGEANEQLLRLHEELVSVLLAIAFFNVRFARPVQSLFGGMVNVAFFADIKRPLAFAIPEPDLLLRKTRTDFVCRIVSAAVDIVREDVQAEQVFLEEHERWMERVWELVEVWKLDAVEIKRHQVNMAARKKLLAAAVVRRDEKGFDGARFVDLIMRGRISGAFASVFGFE